MSNNKTIPSSILENPKKNHHWFNSCIGGYYVSLSNKTFFR